ncbi:hypothetical protein L596_026590 [Steinernema carpocapsae]|uniref:7TM GPCR serpentine receptor class x (Srx) domain-containing protein n=1 Tax=Steinernema carpocapsae TaxID=34508 RepID=A0A4U5M1T5_STECR|nr:hypothetical protein L596_026590 [Steinernema carpocapsae]
MANLPIPDHLPYNSLDHSRTAHLIYGICDIAVVTILAAIYIWITCIQIIIKPYRATQHGKILIATSICHIFMVPGFLLTGVAHILSYDPFRLASICFTLVAGLIRTESMLCLILAINRISILCNVKCLQNSNFLMIVTILAWAIGLGEFILLMTPLAGFRVNPAHFRPGYAHELPYSKLVEHAGFYFLLTFGLTILCVYLAIAVIMKWQNWKYLGSKSTTFEIVWRQEKNIFYQAAARFSSGLLTLITYHVIAKFVGFHSVANIVSYTLYSINYLLVPIFFYLTLDRYISTYVMKKLKAVFNRRTNTKVAPKVRFKLNSIVIETL